MVHHINGKKKTVMLRRRKRRNNAFQQTLHCTQPFILTQTYNSHFSTTQDHQSNANKDPLIFNVEAEVLILPSHFNIDLTHFLHLLLLHKSPVNVIIV